MKDSGSILESVRSLKEETANSLPAFLSGKFMGRGETEGYSPLGRKESNMTRHDISIYVVQYCNRAFHSIFLLPFGGKYCSYDQFGIL